MNDDHLIYIEDSTGRVGVDKVEIEDVKGYFFVMFPEKYKQRRITGIREEIVKTMEAPEGEDYFILIITIE